MAEVTPPPPPPPSPLPVQPAPPPTATVTSPPPALLELPLGARIEATILAAPAANRVEVETALGRLLLATVFPLPKDGPLSLQLLAKGPAPQLQITAIHGLAPQAALRALGLAVAAGQTASAAPAGGGRAAGAPSGQGAAQGVGQGVAQGGAPGVAGGGQPAAINLTVGATVAATVLRPGPPPTATPAATSAATLAGAAGPATPGTTAAAPTIAGAGAATRGPGAATPQPAGPAAAAAGGASAAAATTTASPSAAAAAPPPSAAAPSAGSAFSVRIVAFQPLADGAAPPPVTAGGPPLAPGNTLTGVVTGRAQPSGHPVVQTPAASLIVAARTPLPVGSIVTFEVLSRIAAPAPQPEHPGAHFLSPPLADGGWPALEETLAALADANPAVAQQLAQAVLPRPGATLGANMLFFLMALAGGDLRGWIGDGPMRILQRLRPDLASKLGDDFGRIARVADDRGPGDWRTSLIPFVAGADIQPVKLHTRPAGDDDDAGKGRKGTRFVVDVRYTRIGRLQLDGLVYRKEKHMDLIVRTENPLPPKIENGIRDIFEDAGSVTGIKGGIGFQAAPPNFVEVARPETPSGHVGLIV